MAALTKTVTLILSILSFGAAQTPYNGKLLSSDWGETAHDVAGDVYAVDENTFQILGFSYDGSAPGAVFLLGTDKSYSDAILSRDSTATIIPNPNGNLEALRRYDSENVVLELPNGKVLTDYTYISVWCRNVSVFFGGFDIPTGFSAPKSQVIGQLTPRAHEVQSGDVTVLDDKTIQIRNLFYDGQGPDAFFYVGITDNVQKQTSPHGKIPDENGKSGVITSYSGKDLILTLPDTLSFTQIKWLSIWCVQFDANFGEIYFPENLNVPPRLEISIDRSGMNCEPLSDNLQVSWLIVDDSITFELAGNIDRNVDYMAFGLSGSDSSFSMFKADVVVADWRENEQPRAIDYFITAYSQCANNGGACPDTSSSNNGENNSLMPSGQTTNGILRIKYKRALNTGDAVNDKVYKNDGTAQQIVWAVGPLNGNGEVAKHYPADGRISTAKAINFGRSVVDNCPSFKPEAEVEKPDFKPHHLYGRDGSTVFTAEIGQAGSEQGYKALTGNPSWGIAWYINGVLIPELHLKRGVTYTFRVGGGTNPAAGAKYHPLYFTNDEEGGYQQTLSDTEIIFPGKVNEKAADFAVGGYCEWKLTAVAIDATTNGKVYQCFEEFKNDQYLSCDGDEGYTEFEWTPDARTPDTLYYQCYTHKSLGWKVHIYDTLPSKEIIAEDCTASAGVISSAASAISMVAAFIAFVLL